VEVQGTGGGSTQGGQEQTLFGRVDGMLLDLGVSSMQASADHARMSFSAMQASELCNRIVP
jgi:16S rRNA C1402 N4-methylase RsmH